MFSKYVKLIPREMSMQHVRRLLTSAGENSALTIQETREKLKDLVGAQRHWGAPDTNAGKEVPVAPIATSQDSLPSRRMQDSYREAYIPLGSNPHVKEKYINFYNGIRFGRILEDLDTFAVAIGYTHTIGPSSTKQISPISIVTALVDRIGDSIWFYMGGHFLVDLWNADGSTWLEQSLWASLLDEKISLNHDVRMTGKVTWAGKSSMEITMDLDQEKDNVWKKLMTAKFVMVARDPNTKGAAIINKLEPHGQEEEQLFKEGEESKAKRLIEGQRTLLKTPPSEDERLLIHNLFLETIDPKANTFKLRVKPDDCVWMEDTILKNLVICMPEQRNLYNKIFGGYLMRKAFELAWANAALFSKTRPIVEIVDDIAFRKSVEVGSLLFLSSQVVYCLGTKFQIKVHAEVVNPKDDTRETTNDFYFTFDTRGDPVKTVIPKTYAEAMLYLDGKRHFDS